MPTLRKNCAIPLILAVLLSLAACSSPQDSNPDAEGPTTSGKSSEIPAPPKGAARSTALAGIEKADKVASGWHEDAGLYAVASLAPEVDAEGRSTGWLFTYVSESAGAVASVAVTDEEAKLAPEQELPEEQIKDISNNLLPSSGKLQDSSEAIGDATKVFQALKSGKDVQASAGLDSFSSEKPVWIFSTTQGDKRVEEKVPATRS